MKTEVIALSQDQQNYLDVVNKALEGFLTEREAAERLGLSERQVRRLKKGVRENGAAALIHKNKLRKPNHAMAESLKQKILCIRARAGYKNSNFQHFQELLETQHEISISYSALYRLLKEESIKSPKTRRRFKPHRRRKRRPQAGSLVQMDASTHDWFDTGTTFALHGAIDDATSQITGLYLCKNECMRGYHEVIRRMITIYGVPEAIYADRHTIFRSPNADKAKAENAPPGTKAHDTQFGRALGELGVQIIDARSPQAKGHIERLWETLQSRLPVEFVIRDIKDVEAANEFLLHYVFAYNSEFAVEPSDADNAFLPLDEGKSLDYILCIKEKRVLDHGQVFSYRGQRFQIEKAPYANYIPPKAKVTIMVSPYIGVVVQYLNFAFKTKPVETRSSSHNEEKPAKIVLERIYPPGSNWQPKSGLAWQPGQPSYKKPWQ